MVGTVFKNKVKAHIYLFLETLKFRLYANIDMHKQ